MTNSPQPYILRQRMDSTRILLFGGILLILLGMVLGEVYAIFISHVANSEIRRQMLEAVSDVSRADPDAVQSRFAVIEALMGRRGRIMNTHSRVIAFGYLALTLALLQPLLAFGERFKRLLAQAIVFGALIQTVFVFASQHTGKWSLYLSDAGAFLVILGTVGTLIGLWATAPRDTHLNQHVVALLSSRSSRLLLRAGGLLILAGMVFGFYYAWVFVTQDEPRQWSLLESTLTDAMAGQTEVAAEALASHRTLQSKIAITAAAHSHAIEFGVMALLVAFVQNFVFLSDRWKYRWAWVFVIGSAFLPVFIFHATIFGLVSAGFADLSGFLVILALSAMLFGVLRQMGAEDSRRAQETV